MVRMEEILLLPGYLIYRAVIADKIMRLWRKIKCETKQMFSKFSLTIIVKIEEIKNFDN